MTEFKFDLQEYANKSPIMLATVGGKLKGPHRQLVHIKFFTGLKWHIAAAAFAGHARTTLQRQRDHVFRPKR